MTAVQLAEGPLARIEPQVGFALRIVGPVALKTILRENRTNVTRKVDFFIGPRRGRQRDDTDGQNDKPRRTNAHSLTPLQQIESPAICIASPGRWRFIVTPRPPRSHETGDPLRQADPQRAANSP